MLPKNLSPNILRDHLIQLDCTFLIKTNHRKIAFLFLLIFQDMKVGRKRPINEIMESEIGQKTGQIGQSQILQTLQIDAVFLNGSKVL